MRSMTPMPGNPWPHDMVLYIDDDHVLEDLLWVRHALRLAPVGDEVPPAIWNGPALPDEALSASQAAAAASLWLDAWHERIAGLIAQDERRASPEFVRMASDPAVSQLELERAIRKLSGSTRWPRTPEQSEAWREPLSAWRDSLHEHAHERDPEREIVGVTAAAWRRGLEHIIELPIVGEYTRTLSHRTLMVTSTTRADPEAYARALESFAL